MTYELHRYSEPFCIDLRPGGHYRKRRRGNINYIVLHWGGSSAHGLERALNRRNISTHYMVDGSDIYHVLPVEYQAWHAGYPNAYSVGVDICQQPTVAGRRVERLRAKGFDVAEVNNPSPRGDRRIVTLNTLAVDAVRAFLPELCDELGVPYRVPRGVDGLADEGELFDGVMSKRALKNGAFRGIVGHHHTRSTKWDIAPWWRQLFGGDDVV